MKLFDWFFFIAFGFIIAILDFNRDYFNEFQLILLAILSLIGLMIATKFLEMGDLKK